ncbi:MAG: hypothetical protein H8D56_24435 [Planctomycetes bacterium]|nr:hypothetical protein [Planctomycetota bacterium]MBL7145039.1 hypothetical protein [Phycisphaerae bacterium]
MKYVKYILGFILVIILSRLIGGQVGRFLADRANQVSEPTYSLTQYEYTDQPSTKIDLPEYISPKHSFGVRFFTQPSITNYGKIVHYEFGAETELEAAYNIFINNYEKPLLTDKAIQGALQGYLQGRLLLLGEKGKLIYSREVLFLGQRALDYEYTKDIDSTRAYFKGIYIVVEDLGYAVSVTCSEETKKLAYSKYADFVKSFRLIREH